MAGNTIAKLAVVMTADTGPLSTGMRNAGKSVKDFSDKADSSNQQLQAKMAAFGRSFIGASKGVGRFGGALGALGAVGGPVGIAAVAFVAAAGATLKWTVQLAKLADSQRDARIEIQRAHEAAAAISGQEFEIKFRGATNKELEERLKGRLGDAAEMSGLSMKSILGMSDTFAMLFNVGMFSDEARGDLSQAKADAAAMAEETKRMLEHSRQTDEWIKSYQSTFEQAIGRMKSRAQSLAESLRTPQEVLRDSFKELDNLRDAGFLNQDIFTRGLQGAADAYSKALGRMTEAKSVGSIGAMERGSAEEVGFRLKSTADDQARIEHERKQATLLEEIKKIQSDALSELRHGAGVKLKVGTLK